MKPKSISITFFLLFFFSFSPSAFAGAFQLLWNSNTEADVSGYNIYYGKASRSYGPPIPVGKVTEYRLDGLEDGTLYYLALTAVDSTGNESGYTSEIEVKTAEAKSAPPVGGTPPPLVSAVASASGRSYAIGGSLANGSRAYTDRSFIYADLPAQLAGNTYIMTAQKDKKSKGDAFLSFQVDKRVTVYIVHDDRISKKPAWLSDFTDTGLKLKTQKARKSKTKKARKSKTKKARKSKTKAQMSVYSKVYDAGSVTLGGNGGRKRSSMYTVVVSE